MTEEIGMRSNGKPKSITETQLCNSVEQLKSSDNENAYHSLLEFEGDITSFLMIMYDQENDTAVKAQLIEIIYQRQQDSEVLRFLAQAVKQNAPTVWKTAIDGIVSIGGNEALTQLMVVQQECAAESLKTEWIIEAINQIKQIDKPNDLG